MKRARITVVVHLLRMTLAHLEHIDADFTFADIQGRAGGKDIQRSAEIAEIYFITVFYIDAVDTFKKIAFNEAFYALVWRKFYIGILLFFLSFLQSM